MTFVNHPSTNSKNDDWNNDTPADLKTDEQTINQKDLASFSSILRFASTYWGGTAALLAMAAFITGLIYLVTNEVWYESVRTNVSAMVSAIATFNMAAFWSLAWLSISIVLSLGLAYYLIYKKLKSYNDMVSAWGLALLIIVLSTINVKLGVELIEWSGSFWEDIKNKEVAKFIPGLMLFAQLAFTSIVVGTYRIFFSQMLQVRWRTWLTARASNRYLSNHRFYHLEQHRTQDNPDQRIADDLDRFTSLGISLFFGFYLAALSVYEYSNALIKIAGDIEFEFDLLGHHFSIANYMFWAVLIYTIIGSTVIHFIGRRLVKINFLTERYNANFRYHLIRAREYAEGIGFLRGDAHHIRTARHLFGVIRANWYALMWRIKYLGFSSSIYAQFGIIFPVVVAVPRYFAGTLTFGGIMQVIRAFGELRDSLSWFIDNYSTITELRASSTRLFNLEKALKQIDAQNEKSALAVSPNNTGGVVLSHVYLNRPQFDEQNQIHETPQVLGLDWQITPGQRWLITGASGSGKSTILRAIAALWPYGRGHIDVPQKSKIQFLPQRPYFPVATLRDALAYPAAADAYTDAAYETVLEMSQLKHLQTRLSETNNWLQVLSGGEQQRLAFARVFLQRPDYLFLDEATASLDLDNEHALYTTLVSFLPNLTLVSVSHHEQLKEFHNHALHLTPDELGGFKAKTQTI